MLTGSVAVPDLRVLEVSLDGLVQIGESGGVEPGTVKIRYRLVPL